MELRKSKKEDHLLKRRNLDLDDEPLSPLQEQNRAAAANMSVEDIVAGTLQSRGFTTYHKCLTFFCVWHRY